MDLHQRLNRQFAKYVDVAFFLKFLLVMAGLYGFNLFYIGITDPRGYIYSSFLVRSRCLDYVYWTRASIVHTANLMARGFGINSYVAGLDTVRASGGPGVYVGWPCLGLGIMSFWVAFTLAQDSGWRKKLLWAAGGVLLIWLVNCLRVAVVLVALHKHWPVNKYMDHHTMFTWVVYLVILLMICTYYRLNETGQSQSQRKGSYPTGA